MIVSLKGPSSTSECSF